MQVLNVIYSWESGYRGPDVRISQFPIDFCLRGNFLFIYFFTSQCVIRPQSLPFLYIRFDVLSYLSMAIQTATLNGQLETVVAIIWVQLGSASTLRILESTMKNCVPVDDMKFRDTHINTMLSHTHALC